MEKTVFFLELKKWLPGSKASSYDCAAISIKNNNVHMMNYLHKKLDISLDDLFSLAFQYPDGHCFKHLMQHCYTPQLGFHCICSVLNQNKQHRFDIFLDKGVQMEGLDIVQSMEYLLKLAILKGSALTVDALLDRHVKPSWDMMMHVPSQHARDVFQVVFAHGIIFSHEQLAAAQNTLQPNNINLLQCAEMEITICNGVLITKVKCLIDSLATIARVVNKCVSNPATMKAVMESENNEIKPVNLVLTGDLNTSNNNNSLLSVSSLGGKVKVTCEHSGCVNQAPAVANDGSFSKMFGIQGDVPDIAFMFQK